VGDPVVAIGAEDLRELPRRLQSRLRKLDRLERNRLLDLGDLEAEPLVNRLGRCLERAAVGLLVLEPPAPMLAPAGGGLYQWTPRIR
jgi:hypothetical protein